MAILLIPWINVYLINFFHHNETLSNNALAGSLGLQGPSHRAMKPHILIFLSSFLIETHPPGKSKKCTRLASPQPDISYYFIHTIQLRSMLAERIEGRGPALSEPAQFITVSVIPDYFTRFHPFPGPAGPVLFRLLIFAFPRSSSR